MNLSSYGLHVSEVHHNLSAPSLVALALTHEKDTVLSSTGALICYSGDRTGRSPKDKRIVKEDSSRDDIWWGKINIPMSNDVFTINKQRAIDFLNTVPRLYISDVYAGKHPKYRMKIRVITTRAYHALFIQNMFEPAVFDKEDFLIINAGEFPANIHTTGMTSKTSIDINFESKSMVILGTLYAGEMKKGIFSILHYYYPKFSNILTLHSSANQGIHGDVSIFFGLSGTGKTTLSTDPNRMLIGDDELAWYDDGVFNIESGCYAKTIHLSEKHEPYIYNAIKFGSVLENVVYDKKTHEVDYNDGSITENTRVAYPMSYIPNSSIDGCGGIPKNIILLTCDAFGVLPAVAKLTKEQVMYYFISGYTAVVAGTVMGVKEPNPEFSACFGDAFLTLHPQIYANLLSQKMDTYKADAWLVNTGWMGGNPNVGTRISIQETRNIIDAIHDGTLSQCQTKNFDLFNLSIPIGHPTISPKILDPKSSWTNSDEYDRALKHLRNLFIENFKQYNVSDVISNAGPEF